MKIQRIREIIFEEMQRILGEAEGDNKDKEKLAKEKDVATQNKADFKQQKLDFNKKKFDYTQDKDYEKEQEKEEQPQQGEQDQAEPEKKPNISFKTQGQFYEEAYPELRNLVLSNGNLIDEDERKYIALAVQAAEGRVDKGFDRFLRKGRAGNVYGKDFSEDDISKIIKYCRFHELVR